jgi:hypothetical protein
MGYVPGKIIVHGDAAVTANNIAVHETLFRLGITSELVDQAGFIFVALALYDLFKGVNRRHGSLMVVLIVVSIPIAFLNELNSFAALALVRGADFLSVLDKPQGETMATLFLNLHSRGFVMCEMFWGLWLFPLALAAYLQGAILASVPGSLACPRGFCLGHPEPYEHTVARISGRVNTYLQPAMTGEIVFMLWLLIKGAKPHVPDAATS